LNKVTQEQIDNARKELYIEEAIDLCNISYKVLPNLNSTDEHPIIYAKDNVTGKIPLATHYDTQTKELEWVTAGIGLLLDSFGISFGYAVRENYGNYKFDNNSEMGLRAQDIVSTHSTIVVPEEGFEWRYLVPSENSFNTEKFDSIVQYAVDNSLTLRGQPLIESAKDRMSKWLLNEAYKDLNTLQNNSENQENKNSLRDSTAKRIVDPYAKLKK